MTRIAPLAGAAAVALCAMLVGDPMPATAAGCASPGRTITTTPWAQAMLDPDQVAPLSTGAGVTVAVLDTGVDAQQPQLSGRVLSGRVLSGNSGASTDCAGHGTQVAGIIAAQHSSTVAFHGLAPDARILPVQVASSDTASDGKPGTADPAALASGITWAAGHGAAIIVVSLITYQNNDALRSAVSNATNSGALVIAPVGDQATSGNPTPYPAAYPGVLGVGAIQSDASRWGNSGTGSYTDLVAPGAAVVTTQTGSGLVQVNGTAYAAAYAAATAALVRRRWPGLSPAALTKRLESTAAPADAAAGGTSYGAGILDPYQAVADQSTDASPSPVTGVQPGSAVAHPNNGHEVVGAAVGAGLTGLVLAGAFVLPLARRRGWRAGATPLPADDPEAELPSAPMPLFSEQT